ncbi:MAG TPA: hypothetical protein EYN96_10695 [Candidatus Hydrogenedentes bacterium]|nr:hypothetical protein [Candidatus Hydrogenedentota bacterium]
MVDTLAHSGIDFSWTTLDALLSNESNAASVYLFPDLFQISTEARAQLHAFWKAQQATAIWLFAPGYIGESADVDNISALTGITTSLRDSAKKSGSKFAFSGTWIEENQDYGIEQTISPTFESNDEYADPLARYRDDDSISAAMKYLEDGWTSIAIYEPTLTSELLRDLFYIMEIPLDVSVMGRSANPIAYSNSDNILLYSPEDTVANLEFDTNRDVLNVLDVKQGWTDSRTVKIDLKAGETVLLNVR